MDIILHSIASCLIYLVLVAIIALLSNEFYKNRIVIKTNKYHLPIALVVCMSVAFAIYNWFNTVPGFYGGDRYNYYLDYTGRATDFPGFNIYVKVMYYLTQGNFDLFLYSTTFISCLFLFLIYSFSNNSTPYTLLFLLSTNFVFFTFTGLKQSISGVFINTVFYIVFNHKKSIVADIVCALLIILACTIHITGYVLIPIYLILRLDYKRDKKTIFILSLLVVSVIFIKPILMALASLTQAIMPALSQSILMYIDEDVVQGEGLLPALKGFPYYYLTYFTIVNRKRFVSLIAHYDQLLISVSITSAMYVSTIVSYWFSRFSLLFIVPAALLFGELLSVNTNKSENKKLKIFVLLPLLLFTLRSLILVYVNYGGY